MALIDDLSDDSIFVVIRMQEFSIIIVLNQYNKLQKELFNIHYYSSLCR